MNHLTEWERDEYVLGGRTPAATMHLELCAECRAAVARVEGGLGFFRESALSWSAECAQTRVPSRLPRRAAPRRFAHQWAAGCVAAGLALAAGLVSLHPRQAPAAASGPETHLGSGAGSGLTDDALLEQVDRQVADNVPEAMQPLAPAAREEAR